VFGLLVAVYALFVALFTAAHGVEKLGNALVMPVPLALFPVMLCLFPLWAGPHGFNWALAGEILLVLTWNLVNVHHRSPVRLWLSGLILLAVANCILNLLSATYAN
jgi:hypothetical protein